MCVELDAGQTPDAVNYLYFCHNARNLVSVGQRVKSGDALAVMGNTGNAALASPPFAHCHFEVRDVYKRQALCCSSGISLFYRRSNDVTLLSPR